MSNSDEPDFLSSPGDTILEHLKIELSRALALEDGKIDDLLKGKMPIDDKLAYLLEKRFGIAAEFWIRREHLYREKLADLNFLS